MNNLFFPSLSSRSLSCFSCQLSSFCTADPGHTGPSPEPKEICFSSVWWALGKMHQKELMNSSISKMMSSRMIHKSRYTILSSIHLYFSSFPSVCKSLISRIKCYSKTHKFTSIWYGVFKIKFWKCRVSAACFVNLPPKRNVRGTLPSHVVSPDLKEVFSRLCCLFLWKRSHLFCCTECFWYPDTCSGRERLLHWAAHFQMRCCSCATCKSTEQLNYS